MRLSGGRMCTRTSGSGLAQGCEGWNTSLFFLAATPAEVESCLAAGADLNAQTIGLGYTPLHWAVWFSDDSVVIEALLDAGADATARDEWGRTPWDLTQENEALRGTDIHWQLNEGLLDSTPLVEGWDGVVSVVRPQFLARPHRRVLDLERPAPGTQGGGGNLQLLQLPQVAE